MFAHRPGRLLFRFFRKHIRSGDLSGRVPSAKTLAQEQGVSHRTTERALATLKDEGLVVAVVGKGFYTVRS